MKEIKIDLVDEKIVYDKLENGLEVYIIRKKDFNSNYASFISKFGGLDIEFIPIGEKEFVKMPAGIAHFLEHKLFEQEKDPQVHDFYKQSGTYVNAMTGYKRTKYIFNGPNNFKENLIFLLDYVQSPYFTDEELNNAKSSLESGLLVNYDNIGVISNNLKGQVLLDLPSLDELQDIYKSVTKEEVIELSKKLELDVEYLLKGVK